MEEAEGKLKASEEECEALRVEARDVLRKEIEEANASIKAREAEIGRLEVERKEVKEEVRARVGECERLAQEKKTLEGEAVDMETQLLSLREGMTRMEVSVNH